MANSLGVVGGFGAGTGFGFCSSLSNRLMKSGHDQPHILLDSVSVSGEEMGQFAQGRRKDEFLSCLAGSVRRLNALDVTLIAIPCNTAHAFCGRLRAISRAPIISIIEETAIACREKGLKQAGILGTTLTSSSGLYARALGVRGMTPVFPSLEGQAELDRCIVRLNTCIADKGDEERLRAIAGSLRAKGADGVVLGCTDLSFLAPALEKEGHAVVDSLYALECAVAGEIAPKSAEDDEFDRRRPAASSPLFAASKKGPDSNYSSSGPFVAAATNRSLFRCAEKVDGVSLSWQ